MNPQASQPGAAAGPQPTAPPVTAAQEDAEAEAAYLRAALAGRIRDLDGEVTG
jgi:hypothetical protein